MSTKIALALVAISASVSVAGFPATRPAVQAGGDGRNFAVRAIAPDVPAMRCELTVDAIDREPGDAAGLYLQAMILLPDNAEDLLDRPMDMHDAGKSLADDPVTAKLLADNKRIFDLLAPAARREECDWNLPFRDLGIATLMPELYHLRTLANLLRVKCYRQIDKGQISDAVQTIRQIYALGRDSCKGTPAVGSLVGLGIADIGSGLVEDLDALPDSPNLYWPLAYLPDPIVSFRRAMENERQILAINVPVLAKGKHGGITTEDWPLYLKQIDAYESAGGPRQPAAARTDISAVVAGLAMLPNARKFYASSRHVSLDAAEKVDSGLVLATYFIEQYQIATDEQSKLLCEPLYEAIEQSQELPAKLKKMGIQESNVAALTISSMTRLPIIFGRAQRHIAALTAIQALRAYAAGHGGRLPARLEEVTETPVPLNPMTGRMFDYRLDGEAATLSDQTSPGSTGEHGHALVYTLSIVSP